MTDGLWTTTTRIGENRQYFADVFAQQAGFIGVIFEADGPKMLALRLRIKNMEIKEVEMVTARPGSSDPMGNNLENWAPQETWGYMLEPSERRPRHEMDQIANQYFEAIEKDEKGIVDWHEDCSGGGGREANGSGSIVLDPDAPPMPPEFSAMMTMICDGIFGNGMMGGPVQMQPNAGIIAEAFQIIDGKVRRLDAVTGMTYAYGTRTAW
ncbi:MAG: hypothetical protein WA957_07685 [Alteraurantiacibacter sp.]